MSARPPWPVVTAMSPRYGDLGTDGRMSTVALARWFEHVRVDLRLERYTRLRADDAHPAPRWLLAAQHVERLAPVALGAPTRVGVGIRHIGRTSFAHGYEVSTADGVVATGTSVLVLADGTGPVELPDALRADLTDLLVEDAGSTPPAPPRPADDRHDAAYYPVAVPLRARIGDLDTNRHANNVALVGWYAEAVAVLQGEVLASTRCDPPPALAPWRFRVHYLHEVGYPARYDLGIAVAAHDDDVHYELGLFHDGRCVGLADATGARGELPPEALAARRPVT